MTRTLPDAPAQPVTSQLSPQESFFTVSNSHIFALTMCLLYLGPHITGWRLSDQRRVKKSGWRVVCVIWQYFSTTTCKLPLKAGHAFYHALRHFTTWYQNSGRDLHMLPQKGLTSKQKEEGLMTLFRGLHSVINRWMRVIKQSRQDTEELKTKMEIGFLTHTRMSRTSLCKDIFWDESFGSVVQWTAMTAWHRKWNKTDFSFIYKQMYLYQCSSYRSQIIES